MTRARAVGAWVCGFAVPAVAGAAALGACALAAPACAPTRGAEPSAGPVETLSTSAGGLGCPAPAEQRSPDTVDPDPTAPLPHPSVPPMDAERPARTETATFALG
ncbi:MAG: hypothetical protein Kow0092_22540 [Deferrisomatales bacterium]